MICEDERDEQRILNSKCDYEGQVAVDETESVLWAKVWRILNVVLTKNSCKRILWSSPFKSKIFKPFPWVVQRSLIGQYRVQTEENTGALAFKFHIPNSIWVALLCISFHKRLPFRVWFEQRDPPFSKISTTQRFGKITGKAMIF